MFDLFNDNHPNARTMCDRDQDFKNPGYCNVEFLSVRKGLLIFLGVLILDRAKLICLRYYNEFILLKNVFFVIKFI